LALTWLGVAAVKAKFVRLLMVILAERGVLPPPAVTVTLTVPLVTLAPDHELVFVDLVTVTPLVSVNFQFE
jgi:hypothetical protein